MRDDLSLLLNSLNDAQRQAVAAPVGHQLVLAGAGSGKTRVLVHRIAWLIQVENASPHSILSVTFTNKAAAEMRHRIEQLMGINPAGMWVGTFHGLAHRLLRAHWQEAKLSQTFQILDSDDQQRLVKRVIRELGLDEQRWPSTNSSTAIIAPSARTSPITGYLAWMALRPVTRRSPTALQRSSRCSSSNTSITARAAAQAIGLPA